MIFYIIQDLNNVVTKGNTFFVCQSEIKFKTKVGTTFMLQITQIYHYTLKSM
jgi:hypothetical protein